MINTAAREGFPNDILEASAHKCAIFSAVDPDSFASQFGCHTKDDDFTKGLNFLLENHNWKKRGERGYEYIKETFETNLAIDQHISVYNHVLSEHNF